MAHPTEPLPTPPWPHGGVPRKRSKVKVAGAVLAGMTLLLGCCGFGAVIGYNVRHDEPAATSKATPTPSPTKPPAKPPTAAAPSARATAVSTAPVPNVVGKRLADAETQLEAAGFKEVTRVDATGQGRLVIDGNNWIVQSQVPGPGSKAPIDTEITVRVSRPSDGQGTVTTVAGVVPNVVCKDLQDAQGAMRAAGFNNLESKDGLGRGRPQIIDRNWVVTYQSAAPGSRPALNTSVTLTVVKFGESTGKSGCKS